MARRNKFTNWQTYFNANQGAAQKQADDLAIRQDAQARAAQEATKGALNKFSQQAGVGNLSLDPTKDKMLASRGNVGTAVASNAPQGFRPGAAAGQAPTPAVTPAAAATATPQPQQAQQTQPGGLFQGRQASPTAGMRTGREERLETVIPTKTPEEIADATAEARLADAEARAAAAPYSGPESLVDIEGIDKVVAQNMAAQEGLDALGNEGGIEALTRQARPTLSGGESSFDAALASTAGRSKFDKLRQQFSLQKDFQKAQELASKSGAKKKADMAARAAMGAEEAEGIRGEIKTRDEKRKRREEEAALAAKKAEEERIAKDPWNNIPESEWEIKDKNGNIITDPKEREKAIAQLRPLLTAKTPEERAKAQIELTRQAAAGGGMSGFSQPGDYSTDNLHETDTWKWFGQGWGA